MSDAPVLLHEADDADLARIIPLRLYGDGAEAMRTLDDCHLLFIICMIPGIIVSVLG